jgi:lipid-binding SYLF domain-containing protein
MTKLRSKSVLGFAALFLMLLPGRMPAAADKQGPGEERVGNAIDVIREMADLDEVGLPSRILKESFGIAVIPGVIKAAWGIGGQFGRGIICVRNEDGGWSAPAFISLVGGSVGWQIGVEKADIILVFKTLKSIDDIASGKVTLGADLSVAAGPVGRSAEASTDIDMKAEIYSYSKSKGLFAGLSIKGASIRIDKDANEAFYKKSGASAYEILHGGDIQAPPIVKDLKRILEKVTSRRI